VDGLEMTVEPLSLGCQTSEYCPFGAGRYCQARILRLLDDLIPPPAESGLTPREHEVLNRVVLGRLNKEIASELGITICTVKEHRGRVMEKMKPILSLNSLP
jgi:DNA-binding NarL/FixJ family response regulator